MSRIRARVAVVALLASTGLAYLTAAQSQAVQPPAPPIEAPTAPPPTLEAPVDFERATRPAMRVGGDYTLGPGDEVREVLVIGGNVTIEGRVRRDVVVIVGNAELAGTARVDGSLVVVGGNGRATSGASVGRDLLIVGGDIDAPVGFAPGGDHVVIGLGPINGSLQALFPWVARGLLYGRPIVPGLPWVWALVSIVFLVYLVIAIVLDRPVLACAETVGAKPATTFAAGLLVLLLVGPVCLLLIVSIVGAPVVPFVLCGLVVAGVIGRVGAATWIGSSVLRQETGEGRLQSLLALTVGFAILSLAYMVPVLGLAVWTMLGVFGLGAATLAFIAAYRVEHPAPVPVPTVAAPVFVSSDVNGGPAMRGPDPSSIPLGQSGVAPAAWLSDLMAFPRASFRDRLAASVLDLILVMIAWQLLDPITRDNAVFLLWLAYYVAFWAWKGTTIGGIICQLRVVRVDGQPLRFVDALVRGLSGIFSLAVVGLGFLWILRDAERQAWHDKIAGTYVVKVSRNWPL